jgi:hypothetical protein
MNGVESKRDDQKSLPCIITKIACAYMKYPVLDNNNCRNIIIVSTGGPIAQLVRATGS